MKQAVPVTVRRLAGALLTAAGTLAPCAAGFAQELDPGVSVQTSATAFQTTDGPYTEAMAGTGGVSSQARAAGQSGGLTGEAWSRAWGVVDVGRMQLQVRGGATLNGQGPVGQVSTRAEARALLSDSFLIDCAQCVEGTEATVTFSLVAYGNVQADGQASQVPEGSGSRFTAASEVSSGFWMGAPDAYDPSQPVQDGLYRSTLRWSNGGEEHDRPRWNGVHTARFTVGQPLSFEWRAVLQGSASVDALDPDAVMNGSASFDTDFGSSFYWGGISEVRDLNGQLLGGITARNAAGVDYAASLAPVPEPAAALLAALGALVLLASRWRRSARDI